MELRAPSRKQEAAVGKKHSKFQTITLCGTEYFINDVRTIDGTTVLRTAVRWGASSHRAPSRCSHQHVEHHGEAPFRAIAADDHEGNVAKRADAPTALAAQPAWVKIKNKNYSRRAAVEV